MRPKSAGDRLAAGLRSQAAAQLIPFGLINQFNMAAKGFTHRMVSGVARASWIKPSLILLTAGLWCLPLPGATDTNTREFEMPPPQPGSSQWDINQRIAKELQERYRKRVPLPDAFGGNVPRSATTSLINGPKIVAVPTRAPTVSFGSVLQMLSFAAVFVLTGVLIIRRFAPQVLVGINQQFNPWALTPATGTVRSA